MYSEVINCIFLGENLEKKILGMRRIKMKLKGINNIDLVLGCEI